MIKFSRFVLIFKSEWLWLTTGLHASIRITMGEVVAELWKFLQRVVTLLLAKWLASNPFVERYIWHIAAVFLAFVAVWFTVTAFRHNRHKVPNPPKPSTALVEAAYHKTSPVELQLTDASRTTLVQFQRLVRKLEVEGPKGLRIPLIISIGILLFAVFGNWSRDFFILLRVIVFMTCALALTAIWKVERSSYWVWVLLCIALLYNPLFLIHLHKSTWVWINCITFTVLGVLAIVLKPVETAQSGNNGQI